MRSTAGATADVIALATDDDTERYQPAIGSNRIDIFTVFRKIDYKGFDELKTNEDDVYREIEKLMSEIEDCSIARFG